AIPDDKLVLEKLNEFNLSLDRLPVVSNGAHIGAPDILNVIGADLLEGLLFVVANWGAKGQEELIERFKEQTGEPWLTQDSVSSYGDMWILKEALEQAGAADREQVAEAIRAMDTTEGPARYFPGGRMAFDEKGRRADAALLIVQWQNGVPVTVFPPESALAEPRWPKS
ncbi:MAG TPA: ABC transporter substrate-binding protein, partial [Geminicoccaceae bacterium]|nr:ABC transporter substrate-binding protein [Geminicoccaceae bacterium]